MNKERSDQDSLFSRWPGRKLRQIVVVLLALVVGTLFTAGFRSSSVAAAPGTSSHGDGAFSARVGPCHSIQSAGARFQVSQESELNSPQLSEAGARRYVAAWPRAVFHYFTTLEKWPTLLDVREICGPEEPIGVGSDFRLLSWSGVEVEGIITGWQKDRHFAAQLQADGMNAPIFLALSIEPVPDGSEVQLDAVSAPQGLVRLLVPQVNSDGRTDSYLDGILRRIKVSVER